MLLVPELPSLRLCSHQSSPFSSGASVTELRLTLGAFLVLMLSMMLVVISRLPRLWIPEVQ